jgi:hypothetical protein
VRKTFLIAVLSILPLLANATAASAPPADLSAAALKKLVPEGYKVEKTIPCNSGQGAQQEHLVALSDAEEVQFKEKPVMILLVAAGKKVVVEDSVTLHNTRTSGWPDAPNYFTAMTRQNVGGGDLFLITSMVFGGGSGSLNYFDFYQADKKKLRLVKSFSHGRMQVPYFAVYKNAIYDAECVCTRGEKHGKAFVYTCYLQVTKYTFDGEAIRPVGSERMREQKGNRFMQDKYWFISVLKALQKHEIFAEAP